MYEFEKHPKLTEFIQEMAITGRVPREWTSFIETLNQALRIHDVSGRSGKFPHPNCDGGEIEAEKLNLLLMFNQCTNVCFSTKAPLLQSRC